MDRVTFFYIKSPHHSEIKVDGAIGGATPTAELAVSVYTERPAIPQRVVQTISPEGRLGEELTEEREGKEGVVRVVQATLHMNLDKAKALHEWLGRNISQIEQALKDS